MVTLAIGLPWLSDPVGGLLLGAEFQSKTFVSICTSERNLSVTIQLFGGRDVLMKCNTHSRTTIARTSLGP